MTEPLRTIESFSPANGRLYGAVDEGNASIVSDVAVSESTPHPNPLPRGRGATGKLRDLPQAGSQYSMPYTMTPVTET